MEHGVDCQLYVVVGLKQNLKKIERHVGYIRYGWEISIIQGLSIRVLLCPFSERLLHERTCIQPIKRGFRTIFNAILQYEKAVVSIIYTKMLLKPNLSFTCQVLAVDKPTLIFSTNLIPFY